MKTCTCESRGLKPRPQSNPRKKACNRCGFNIPEPKPEVEREPEAGMRHHCSRCRVDVYVGQPRGLLYLIHPNGRTEESLAFCERCTKVLFEAALNYKTPEEVEAEYLHAA